MKKLFIYNLIFFFSLGSIIAQQTPAPKQSQDIVIVGATAHLGNGEVIENSLIYFKDGKLSTIAKAQLVKMDTSGKRVIDATGKHVYPGFIALNASLGLSEIDAVRATRDFDEVGQMIPHIRSLIAYNAESQVVESMRPNGVLQGEIAPRGGTISGSASVMQFDAWNWEDAAIKVDHGIHMNWPGAFTRGRWWLGEDAGLRPDKNYPKRVQAIKDFFMKASQYLNGPKSTKNIPYEATAGLFNGAQKLFIHVEGTKEITDAINTAKSVGINDIVVVNGTGAEKVADLLVKNNIPVVIDRAHRIPDNIDDDYDLPFRNAKILMDAGIMVSIGMQGQMERMNTRNLPFYAGTYAAYGVPKEKAVQMITGNAAKILGIDSFTGTLEAGKDATLFISEGDALDMRSNIVTHAFIQGREVSLETHQTKLWKRYLKKVKSK
ncbi:MAG: amidohydrolase [Flavobacteriaceae bacterium]|nr:amidohydrolase [Flavobacteriaceae bacterium]|tara:strand:+ start:372848 stop:374152 length:1305 start_codon:yes stop_codon:yes gene_type:complete